MLDGALPIGVLVHYRCQYFIQVIAIGTLDIILQYLRPPIGLDAVLNVFRVEDKIGFRPSNSHQHVVPGCMCTCERERGINKIGKHFDKRHGSGGMSRMSFNYLDNLLIANFRRRIAFIVLSVLCR